MGCKLTISLISETQEGNIGSDWKYDLGVKVFNQGLQGQGKISVPKHQLDSGDVQPPPGPPDPLDLEAGEGGGDVLVRLELLATEVDMFKNDSGTASMDIRLVAPKPGEERITHSFEVGAGVRESPGILNKNAVITVQGRITLTCG